MQDPPGAVADEGRHDATLDEVRELVADVDGWLTDDQVRALHGAAASVESHGVIVEIGSFRGRSTIVLSAASSSDVSVVAIDPHAGNDRGPQEIEGFEAEAADDNVTFEANLARAGVRNRVRHVRKFSDDAHEEVAGDIDVLFIDGAHRFGPARTDIARWGARVRPGGAMYIHDTFSSVGVTGAVLVELVFDRDWHYLGRDGSLAGYRRSSGPSDRAGWGGSVRQLAALGWFVRNVLIKVLIVAKLGRATRLLGHRQPTWPY